VRPRLAALAVAFGLLPIAACGVEDPSVTAEQRGKPVVVTGVWPLAELAERIGGDRIVVINLTPVGESPHELELTGRQREEVLDADLALVVGRGFQEDVERAAAARDGETLVVFDALDLPTRPEGGHVWLDPTLMGSIATAVGEALSAIDPEAASDHARRAEEVVEEVVALDAQLRTGLESCERDLIVSQHDAFGWFAARYGFETAAFDDADPDDDPAPDPELVDEIEPLLEDGSVVTLFTETLQPGSWLEVIAEEQGLDTAVLNPYEGRTTSEDARDVGYESVMLYDLRVLQDHLDCTVE